MDLPVPVPTDTTRPFWDGLRDNKVRLQYSPSSDQWVFYPRVLAPGTLADDLEWRDIAGGGVVYTYTIAYRPTSPAWRDRVPQVIAVVEVDEGARIPTELVDVQPDDVRVGMRVEPVFDRTGDGDSVLLKFRPSQQ
jgi:uncharacterized OB-fold protein